MSEKCKTCKKEIETGIWLSPQFADEKTLLFCSEKCKKDYLKDKLNKIKSGYPNYYRKILGGTWAIENIMIAGIGIILAGMFVIVGFLINQSKCLGTLEELNI